MTGSLAVLGHTSVKKMSLSFDVIADNDGRLNRQLTTIITNRRPAAFPPDLNLIFRWVCPSLRIIRLEESFFLVSNVFSASLLLILV